MQHLFNFIWPIFPIIVTMMEHNTCSRSKNNFLQNLPTDQGLIDLDTILTCYAVYRANNLRIKSWKPNQHFLYNSWSTSNPRLIIDTLGFQWLYVKYKMVNLKNFMLIFFKYLITYKLQSIKCPLFLKKLEVTKTSLE